MLDDHLVGIGTHSALRSSVRGDPTRASSKKGRQKHGGAAKNRDPAAAQTTLNRVLHKIRPYSAFVVCSLLVAAVSVAAQLYIPICAATPLIRCWATGQCRPCRGAAVSILVVAVAALAQWLLSVQQPHHLLRSAVTLRNEGAA